jgi:hypothetical protein
MLRKEIFVGLLVLASASSTTAAFANDDCAALQNGIAPQIQALASSVATQAKPSNSADIQTQFQANQKSATDISALLNSKVMPSLSEDDTPSAKLISKSLGKIISEKFINDDANDIASMNLDSQSALVQSLSRDLATALQAICE